MDEKELIKMLVVEKLPKKEIAKKLKVSEVAIRKKIQKLKENKILIGLKFVINYKNVGFSYSITGIDIEPEKLIEIIDVLKSFKEIISIYLASGDHTIIVEVLAEDIEKMKEIHKKISSISGVKRVCPSIIHEILKF